MNWTCEATIQNRYLNHKPTTKNTYTTTINFAGCTKEKAMAELERMAAGTENRLVSHGELKPYRSAY